MIYTVYRYHIIFFASIIFELLLIQLYNRSFLCLQCITDQHRALLINSSRDLPDNVLNFARRYPLMAIQIQPVGGRPLLLQRSLDYTKMTAHQVTGLDGHVYDMLFIGTGIALLSIDSLMFFILCNKRKKKITQNNTVYFNVMYKNVCLSPDDGWLHRAVNIRGRMHIIEEMQLFGEKQPINNLVISQKQVAHNAPLKQY